MIYFRLTELAVLGSIFMEHKALLTLAAVSFMLWAWRKSHREGRAA